MKESIKRETEHMFLEAKRSLVAGSTSIPIWVVILLVVLGWNEFITIISSPFYLFITLIIISCIVIVQYLHLGGPLMTAFYTLKTILSSPVSSSDNKEKNE